MKTIYIFAATVVLAIVGEAISNCPKDSIEFRTQCLRFFTKPSTFGNADLACKAGGGRLTSVTDVMSNAYIAGSASYIFEKTNQTSFWIGAIRFLDTPMWTWVDGTLMSFTQWREGEPKTLKRFSCGAVSLIDSSWSDEDCFDTKPFVCSYRKF